MSERDKIPMTISILNGAIKELQFNNHNDLEITMGLLVELIMHVQITERLTHVQAIERIAIYLNSSKKFPTSNTK